MTNERSEKIIKIYANSICRSVGYTRTSKRRGGPFWNYLNNLTDNELNKELKIIKENKNE